jgi:hypothetical protein
MSIEELAHSGYHRVSVSFILKEVPDCTLELLAKGYGAKSYGRRNCRYFFEFDRHPIEFLKSLNSSGLVREYFIEGEPFDFSI